MRIESPSIKPIELRLKSSGLLKDSRNENPDNHIIAKLQDSLMGSNLQYV